MEPGKPTVYAVDEYDSQEFDAVLVQERTIVCLRTNPSLVRVIPLDKVNHIDSDPDLTLEEHEIPESFFGGGEYGFVAVEKFPAIEAHLEDIDKQEY